MDRVAGVVVEAQDSELVGRARQGDGEAFGELVRRHRRLLRQVIQIRVRRAEVTEELVQEVLCEGFYHLASLRDEGRVAHWLARMAANAAAQWLRSQQARQRLEARRWMVPVPAASPRPDEAMETREARLQVQQALGRLPATDWRLIVLYYVEGRTCGEIGHELAMPRETVKSRLWRVRRRLRVDLAQAESSS